MSARKNAGMPMVRPSVTDSWRGRKGKRSSITPKSTASAVEYAVFVRNSIDTRSMFAMTCRPSATTPGNWENRPSSSTRRAHALVAADTQPPGHRNAESGFLVSQRVIHAVAGHRDRMPPALQGGHDVLLLRRRDPAQHHMLLE